MNECTKHLSDPCFLGIKKEKGDLLKFKKRLY